MNNHEHPAHRAVKDALMGNLGEILLTNFYLATKLWESHWATPSTQISYRPIEEYPIVSKPYGVKVNGKPLVKSIYIDFIFVVEPGLGSIASNDCVYIGVEIKSSYQDIANVAEQMSRYREHADFWFLAVPDELIKAAIYLTQDCPWIGVCSYETGKISKIPERNEVPDINRIIMLHRLVFCPTQETKHIFHPDYQGTPYEITTSSNKPQTE